MLLIWSLLYNVVSDEGAFFIDSLSKYILLYILLSKTGSFSKVPFYIVW